MTASSQSKRYFTQHDIMATKYNLGYINAITCQSKLFAKVFISPASKKENKAVYSISYQSLISLGDIKRFDLVIMNCETFEKLDISSAKHGIAVLKNAYENSLQVDEIYNIASIFNIEIISSGVNMLSWVSLCDFDRRIKNTYNKKIYNDSLCQALREFYDCSKAFDDPELAQTYFLKAHDNLVKYIITTCSSTVPIYIERIFPYCTVSQEMCTARCEFPENVKCYHQTNLINNNCSILRNNNLLAISRTRFSLVSYLEKLGFYNTENIDLILGFETSKDGGIKQYIFNLSAFIGRLAQIEPYLHCYKCGKTLHPDYKYTIESTKYRLTVFKCPNCKNIDTVYLNHCIKCRQNTGLFYIIDSRECKHKSYVHNGNAHIYKATNKEYHDDSMYLCMRCGGSKAIASGSICPKCASKLVYTENNCVYCKQCGHNGSLYGVKPQHTFPRVYERNELPF